jgi:succinate-semialdehyde dehydrogenase/glutarate-semialdehyde dehydrogenase
MKREQQDPTGGGKILTSLNPATGEVLAKIEVHSAAEVERRLRVAENAFQDWRRTSFGARTTLMNRAAEILESDRCALARTMTLEMGKPISAAVQEAQKCASACRFYAANAEGFLADERVNAGAGHSFVRYQPLGIVLAVMPWNFPFWQVFRFASPGIMAGNVGLLKHASNVPQCALAIEEVFKRAGFPAGVFQALMIGSASVGRVIEDERVKAVTLTGSVEAGAKVASAAGARIKKTVLELGGSDPFIIMPSADLDRAVATAVQARTINNGQSCIAAKRFIVDRRIAPRFQEEFVRQMAALRVGDPLEESTQIGPLATRDTLKTVEEQVDATVRAGARVLLGGKRVDGPGFFYLPTVLVDIPERSPVSRDEVFGPVASIYYVNGIEEALRLANDTPFGLGSTLWTRDLREQELFIETIEAGLAFINGMVASDPRLPFGGVKQSGFGRELGEHGIREFVNAKTVVIRESEEPATGPGASRSE